MNTAITVVAVTAPIVSSVATLILANRHSTRQMYAQFEANRQDAELQRAFDRTERRHESLYASIIGFDQLIGEQINSIFVYTQLHHTVFPGEQDAVVGLPDLDHSYSILALSAPGPVVEAAGTLLEEVVRLYNGLSTSESVNESRLRYRNLARQHLTA